MKKVWGTVWRLAVCVLALAVVLVLIELLL